MKTFNAKNETLQALLSLAFIVGMPALLLFAEAYAPNPTCLENPYDIACQTPMETPYPTPPPITATNTLANGGIGGGGAMAIYDPINNQTTIFDSHKYGYLAMGPVLDPAINPDDPESHRTSPLNAGGMSDSISRFFDESTGAEITETAPLIPSEEASSPG